MMDVFELTFQLLPYSSISWVTKNIQRELQSDDEKWLNENRPATTPVLDLKKNW